MRQEVCWLLFGETFYLFFIGYGNRVRTYTNRVKVCYASFTPYRNANSPWRLLASYYQRRVHMLAWPLSSQFMPCRRISCPRGLCFGCGRTRTCTSNHKLLVHLPLNYTAMLERMSITLLVLIFNNQRQSKWTSQCRQNNFKNACYLVHSLPPT